MKKRLLSMLLALCMVLVALPVFALAVIAEEGEAEATVSISFCLPDGTEVCKRTAAPGVVNFELPTDGEIAAALAVYNAKEGIKGKYELAATDILGFYEVTYLGEITDAAAYQGAIINADKTFYAFTTKSVFKPGNNWPLFTRNTTLDGYRGGWTVGNYNSSNKTFSINSSFESGPNIVNGGSTWTNGGLYVGDDPHIVTCAGFSTALIWKAIAPGTVDVGMDLIGFTSTNVPGDPKPTYSDIAFAIAKNGTIVWPKAAAGAVADTWAGAGSNAETNKWCYLKSETLTQDMTQAWKDYCTTNDDAPTGITVAAGDEIQIVFKRASVACVSCYPTVTYTEVTGGVDAEAAGICTKLDALYSTSFSSTSNFPAYTPENGTTITFKGNWDFLYYKGSQWGDNYRVLMNKTANFNAKGEDGFFNDGRGLYDGSNAIRIAGGNGWWGGAGSYALLGTKDIGGYRYTAEYTGLADISMGAYAVTGQDSANALVGIFLNGQMIWPNAGNYLDDTSKWATVTSTATTPENLPTDILLEKGDMVEFLMTGGDSGARGINLIPMSVSYKSIYTSALFETATERKETTADISLTVNEAEIADSFTVTVEATNADGEWAVVAEDAETSGLYRVSYAMQDYEPYSVSFRVTMTKGDTTLSTKIFAFEVPSRYAPLIHTGFNTKKNTPTTDADVTFTGNWDFMLYNATSEIGTSAGRLANKYYSVSGTAVYCDVITADLGNNPVTAFFNFGNHVEWGGPTYGAYVRNGAASSYRYIAEDSGFANISIDKLGHGSSPWSSDVSWAIYLNGEKIWPTADTAIEGLTFESGWLRSVTDEKVGENFLTDAQLAAVNAQLTNIYLREGDALEFVCHAPGTSGNWTNCGNICYASVDYVSRNENAIPTCTGISANIGSKYGFTLLTEGGDADIADLELALTFASGRTLTAETIADGFRVSGILPAEMTETITYTLYAVTTNGTVTAYRVLAEGETTYADLLATYLTEDADVKLKDMVIATLQYGAAMQKRTLHNMDNLATSVLGEEDVLSFTLTDPESVYAQEKDATKAYTFTGASLLLQDEIRVKLYIELAEGMEMSEGELFLEYATSADFTGAQRSAVVQRGNEGETWRSNAHLKAILDVMPSAFTGAMYFRVVTADGTVVSTTLTYSVDSYAARVPAEAEMTAAIRALGIATANYLADEA